MKEYKGQCIYCNQPVSSNQIGVGWSKTKRKTVVMWHDCCHMGMMAYDKVEQKGVKQ